MKKLIFNTIKSSLLILTISVCSSKTNVFETKVISNNLNKSVDVTKMSQKVDELDYLALNSPINNLTGDITGYVYNCPLCTGHLACKGDYDLSDGKTTYPDETYGNVRIVASSTNLRCGTIVKFNLDTLSSEPTYAIVLDRGVLDNDLDLLSSDYDSAILFGRKTINYEILRDGWEELNEG